MIENVISQLHYIPQAALLTVVLAAGYLFFTENKEYTFKKIITLYRNNGAIVAFLFYSALLFTGTILGRPHSNPYKNLIGYIDIIKEGKLNVSALGNILIFLPYTFLYIIATKPKKPILYSLYLSVSTTLFIEIFQLLFWVGQFSVADLVYNIIGGMVGCGLWYIIYGIRIHVKTRKDKR